MPERKNVSGRGFWLFLGGTLCFDMEANRALQVRMDVHGNIELAGRFDRGLEKDGLAIDLDAGIGLGEGFMDVLDRNRPERLASLAGAESELQAQLVDAIGKFVGLFQFLRFARRTGDSEVLEAQQVSLGCLEGNILGQEKVARETASYFDHVSFCSEAVYLFLENNFDVCHVCKGFLFEGEMGNACRRHCQVGLKSWARAVQRER